MTWAFLLLACNREPVVEVIPGVTTALEVLVSNPTSCPSCDAFRDVDTLRLEVSVGEDVVASDTFAYPGEDVTLPDLDGFGVVRITLLGLEDGRARTLEEVGREFNVTRERIRQIEAKALRKLRHPSRSRKLKDYLE